ncbi:GL26111 [Drosophila persimilis]|uniref:GL26111 n=1 Tax=Drosophila persimilis TaxID=7234 RepID=B4GKL3_DROPE|nr:metacaspase-1 [Drosophila persimilis]EDW37179.1 GL26111 [Drosophila persimilis]
MEYGNGNGTNYQSMQGYGMSIPDGQPPEGYGMSFEGMGQMSGQGQEYVQSNGYGQEESRGQPGSAAFGGPGYRSPLRYNKMLKEMNSRNGLYSPMEQQRGGQSSGQGDYGYNSLPGLGGNESQGYHHQSQGNGNTYF